MKPHLLLIPILSFALPVDAQVSDNINGRFRGGFTSRTYEMDEIVHTVQFMLRHGKIRRPIVEATTYTSERIYWNPKLRKTRMRGGKLRIVMSDGLRSTIVFTRSSFSGEYTWKGRSKMPGGYRGTGSGGEF